VLLLIHYSKLIRRVLETIMPRFATPIELNPKEQAELERLVRRASTPQSLALRARIILMAGEGAGVVETAEQLGVWRKGVSHWRSRWLESSRSPGAVGERLSDAPRSGTPAKITPEQVCSIVALACEVPADSGLPMSHWSQQALADEAMKRGIVEEISQRSVGRFLKRI
jgi:transposase